MTPGLFGCRRLTVTGLVFALLASASARGEVRTTVDGAQVRRSSATAARLRPAPSAREIAAQPPSGDAPRVIEPTGDATALPLPANVHQPLAHGQQATQHAQQATAQEEIFLEGPSMPPEVVLQEPYFEGPIDDDGHMGCAGWGCTSVACRCRFVRLEAVGWWGPGYDLPVLVSDNILPSNALFGGDVIESDGRFGGRLTFGKWLDVEQSLAIMLRFYAVDDEVLNYQLQSEGGVPIARPFFSLENSAGQVVGPDALFVAGQGVAGQISVTGRNRFTGGDVLLRRLAYQGDGTTVDFLFGYNTARIDEDLVIASSSQLNDVQITVSDSYDAKNEFHGVTLGLLGRRDRGRWGLEVLGKVSLGDMSQQITMDGSATNSQYGLFIQDTNEGVFKNSGFVIAPEVGLNLLYRIGPNLDLTFGYSFLYWNNVARPESFLPYQLAVNPNSPSAPNEIPNPEFRWIHNDYWLQGITAGIGFSF